MTTTHVYTALSGDPLCGATDATRALFWDPQVSVVMPADVNCRACRWKAGGGVGAPPAQCGRTFPHLHHETDKGDCPGLAATTVTSALITVARAMGLPIDDASTFVTGYDTEPLTNLMEDTLREHAHLPPRIPDPVDHWAPRPSYADLITGLTTLAEPGCQNFETGSLGLCPHNGLVERLWCPPCTAYTTLNPRQTEASRG